MALGKRPSEPNAQNRHVCSWSFQNLEKAIGVRHYALCMMIEFWSRIMVAPIKCLFLRITGGVNLIVY